MIREHHLTTSFIELNWNIIVTDFLVYQSIIHNSIIFKTD
jgi:hypothetical protein